MLQCVSRALRRPAFGSIRTMSIKTTTNTYHMLLYNFVDDMQSKRGPTRAAHLDYLDKLTEEKKLAMAGALVDPVDSGLLIFRNCTTEEVERIARDDPYTTGGLVTGWTVRKYAKVQGDAE